MNWHDYVATAVGFISFFVGLFVGTWKAGKAAGRAEKELALRLEEVKAAYTLQISLAEDAIRREFGELVKAMQHKIHEFETWTRDSFVRRDSFKTVIGETKDMVANLGNRLEGKLSDVEKKLDDFILSRRRP